MSEETRLRVIVFREADNWVAHCLEYAISAQARDLDEVKARFEVALHADLAESMRRYGKPFAGILAHQLDAPPALEIPVFGGRLAAGDPGRIEGRPGVAELEDQESPDPLARDLKGPPGVGSEGVQDDVPAAFLQDEGGAEQSRFRQIAGRAGVADRFDRPMDLLGGGLQLEQHARVGREEGRTSDRRKPYQGPGDR